MAMAQGGPVAIRYATEHPERVTRLLFYNSYADAARDVTPEEEEVEDTFDQMINVGWARPDSTFRRVFTSMLIPAATEEQKGWLDDLMRASASASSAYASRHERRHHGASDCLPRIDAPTLVIHATGERINGFDEGRFLATSIRRARLVPLDSENHIILEDEPAWPPEDSTTTTSPASCTRASAPSNGTCRTSTSSSTSRGSRRGRRPSPAS